LIAPALIKCQSASAKAPYSITPDETTISVSAKYVQSLPMADKNLVLSTTGSKEEAQTIARALVERRLAACVNIVGPIESLYRWEGEVQTSAEYMLLVKTTAERFPAVRLAIRELHSYELPECIALEIDNGSDEYLNWIETSVAQ
jgi:periplasmic divalent cation tolerance protein